MKALVTLLVVLVSLVLPGTASAFTAIGAGTGTGGFDVRGSAVVGAFGLVGPEKHQGNAYEYGETASGSSNAARAAPTLSKHAAQQAAARGITESQIRVAVEEGAQYSDRLHGTVSHVLNEGFASGKTLVVARNPATNIVTTVIRQSDTFDAGVKLADGTARFVPIP